MTGAATERVWAHPFFAGLTAEQRVALAGDGRPVAYEPGERIFAEGGPADRFWLIETGSVALDMRVPGRGDQVIETLAASTVLGWSWLLPPYRWQFGAVAREATAALAFDSAAVRRRCADDPAFGYAILCCFLPVITDRLQATRLRVLDLYASPDQAARSEQRGEASR
jgi:CRP-like cAMP-binding protein